MSMSTLSMTVAREPRRYQVNATLGMVVFIASWSMAFATLFLSFLVLRHREPSWPPPGVVLPSLPLASVATAALLASSVVLHRAVRAGRDARSSFPALWGWATALALAFAALQGWLWVAVWNAGGRPDSDMYSGLFYTLTWFHAAHVACGLVALAWIQVGALRGRIGPLRISPASSVALFWHFVDAVWLLLFLSFFVF